MPRYEFKVVPAPKKGVSGKGVRGKEAKFANAISVMMNKMGEDGWDYVRADTLPFEERTGLTSHKTTYQNMLVFRRKIDQDAEFFEHQSAVKQTETVPLRLVENNGNDFGIVGVLKNRAASKAMAEQNKAANIAAE